MKNGEDIELKRTDTKNKKGNPRVTLSYLIPEVTSADSFEVFYEQKYSVQNVKLFLAFN